MDDQVSIHITSSKFSLCHRVQTDSGAQPVGIEGRFIGG